MTPERLAIIKKILDMRQTDLTVVMENVRKPRQILQRILSGAER